MSVEPAFIDLGLKMLGIRDEVEEIVSSGCEGVDWGGEEFSIDFLDKEAKVIPADWSMGAQGGPIRDKRMAEYSDALLVIWDGKSSGSTEIKANMMKLKKPTYEIIIKGAAT